MSKGTVKFFNETKGFGFITEEGSNKEHFVHISGLIDEVREGDEQAFLGRRVAPCGDGGEGQEDDPWPGDPAFEVRVARFAFQNHPQW